MERGGGLYGRPSVERLEAMRPSALHIALVPFITFGYINIHLCIKLTKIFSHQRANLVP